MKHSVFLASVVIAGAGATLAVNADRALMVGGVGLTPEKSVSVVTQKGIVEVTPVTPDIFRVTVFPSDSAINYSASQSAILPPSGDGVAEVVTGEWAGLISPTTEVRIDRATGKVSFYDASGNLLLEEAGGVDNNSAIKSVSFLGEGSGLLSGGGERAHNVVLNGDSLINYNRATYCYGKGDRRISQMNITIPYFVSNRGYGVLFDDYSKSGLKLGSDTILYSALTRRSLSYYFINSPGGDIAGATSNYVQLTGRQDLPPLWTLGYITSKYGYKTQAEAEGVVDTLLSRGYPLDGIVFDLYWYGEETDMGRLEWDKEKWPDHSAMLRSFKDKGVNVVPISQPYLNKKGAIDNYNMLSERGLLVKDSLGNTHDVETWVGEAGMFDVSNPATREWYWNRYKSLTEPGITGWWGDLGEPEVHPSTMRHHNGLTADEYHNVYGNEWSRIIYEGMRKDFPEMRPMLLMRGGTSGLQRYSVFPWSGDVGRSWEGLQAQIPIMLNAGLSGLGYMSSDIGGFAVDPKDPVNPELYVRWLQMGVFNPVLRTHASYQPEPYHYAKDEALIKQYIRMRYQWLPYNYTLAYENSAKGLPLVRPLNFRGDNPGEEYARVDDEYMWGDEVLVAPVMKPGLKSRPVLFPKGDWYSWWNPAKIYKGGKSYNVATPLSEIPLFIKAGSFIPQYMPQIQNVREYNPAVMTIKYFPSQERTGYTLFEDDRKSPTALADGAYTLIHFEGEKRGKEIEISIDSDGSYEGMPEVRMFTIEIEAASKPTSVEIDGNRLENFPSPKMIRQYGWSYEASSHRLSIVMAYSSKAKILIK